MFTDTHCHLAADILFSQSTQILAQAHACGVTGMMVPATQPSDWQRVLALSKWQGVRAVALGLHPWFVGDDDAWESELFDLLKQNPNAWLGEVGLDKCIEIPTNRQLIVLEKQMAIGRTLSRPVILHNVRASGDILALLKRFDWQNGGIVHAFSGSLEEAFLFIKHGFKIGIGSLLLNPNAKKVRQLAAQLPLSAILLETDSPYMLRNAVNVPANVVKIAKIVANLRGTDTAKLAQQLEHNLGDFRLPVLPCGAN